MRLSSITVALSIVAASSLVSMLPAMSILHAAPLPAPRYIREWGVKGTGTDSTYTLVSGLACGPDQLVYVCDEFGNTNNSNNSSRIHVFNSRAPIRPII